MANTIKIKRSAVSGKVPTTAQLELGELAVNTHDGKLYTKKDDGTAAVVQIGGATDLAQGTRTTTTVPVTSSTGTDATLTAATTSLAGVMTSADKSKLDGIASGATNVTNNNQLTNGAGYITSSGSITGNAATATQLATARTIGGVSFNGTANINLPGVNTAGNQNTSGNAASATVLQTARTIGGVSFNGSANINLPGVNTTGNQNTTGSSASCTGNAATASTLQTSRTIALSGDVSGSASFNGGSNITISATVADDSHNHVVSNIDGLQTTLNGKAALASAQTFTAAQRGTVSSLTSAATITPNFATANNFSVSLGTNTTIANPSNLTAGQSGAIVITYSGAYTVAFGSYWKFASGTAPTATSTSGKVDVLVYYVESSTRISAQLLLNMGG